MISARFPFASWFLWLGGASFLVFYALPFLFFPLRWARLFRWTVPNETHLTIYFARCLGAAISAIVLAVFRAAPEPERHQVVFELVIGVLSLVGFVHVWGAIERAQPWTETVEAGVYVLLSATTIYLYCVLF
jgi:hypothetical protein